MAEISHFAINADDPERARSFYERVFGWTFQASGPPGFYHVTTGSRAGAIPGTLQQRRELVPGRAVHGFECTIAVDDLDAVAAAITAAGGRIVGEKTAIPGVGELLFFEDSEGNVAGAMRYAPGAR